ncbi:MAG: hypothetical protein HRT53_10950 [Colwellia sp.]|nr:hypothetical protein [Colwellia sp.]
MALISNKNINLTSDESSEEVVWLSIEEIQNNYQLALTIMLFWTKATKDLKVKCNTALCRLTYYLKYLLCQHYRKPSSLS